jgi:hypothetical protein
MPKNKKELPSMNVTGENFVANAFNANDSAEVNITQTNNQTTNDETFEKLFQLLEEKIRTRPEDPNVGKQEIQDQVKKIKTEAALGKLANPNKLERWIRNLSGMAPDIVDVMAASLGGPVSGLTVLVQKIAARVKAESRNG